MKAIVYTSHAGHTAEYAGLLAEKTGLPAYSLKDAAKAVPDGTTIIYMGWIMGSKIKGYKQAAKRYDIACAIGVGMGEGGERDEDVRVMTKLPEGIALFTLQGGLERKKLKGFYRMMMNRIAPATIKIVNKRKEKTREDLVVLAMLLKGKNAVCIENLRPVLQWYNETTGSSIELPPPKAIPEASESAQADKSAE